MIAAIYARKSTDQTGVADEEKSVTRQVEHARAYAARKGWTVADEHVYVDDGISGAEFVKRPGFVRLMNALKPPPPFQVLIMSEESRLGREQIETAYALKQIMDAGVRVFFYLEDRERTLDSAIDKVMLLADQLRRRDGAREGAPADLRRDAAQGQARHVTGGKVYGYDNVEVLSTLSPDGRPPARRTASQRGPGRRRAPDLRAVRRRAGLHADRQGAERARATPPRGRRATAGRRRRSARFSIATALSGRGRLEQEPEDRSGAGQAAAPPSAERVAALDAPELRIVSEELWEAGSRRAWSTLVRRSPGTGRGRLFGRPSRLDMDSPYLLTGLPSAQCGAAGAR